MLKKDSTYFHELQTQTGWGRMLVSFSRWCNPQPGWVTLDVGCGPGLLPGLFAYAGCRAFGTDIDPAMLIPDGLHPDVAIADAIRLPFPEQHFKMVTVSNLLYLLPDPKPVLRELSRILEPGGELAALNPSEHMTVTAAADLADERQLTGLARDTLTNYASRAESTFRWSEEDLADLFSRTGLRLKDTTLKMGPGLVRFARAEKVN
jgi:ubiquinone/menaquinone biosynthesis C-methylase UbiE